jgi:MFS family permease
MPVDDRAGRGRVGPRGPGKPYVIGATVVMATGPVILAVSQTWPAALAAAAVTGAGYGIYLAVDAALVTQVLPAARDRGKYLGVINIVNSAPQALGPAVAAPIVAHAGGYPALFLATAVVTLLVLVLPIRGVR